MKVPSIKFSTSSHHFLNKYILIWITKVNAPKFRKLSQLKNTHCFLKKA